MEVEFDSTSAKNGDSNAGKSAPTPSCPHRKEQHAQSTIKLVPPHSEPPKGLCFKYWKTGSCGVKRRCKFLHVRNPEKWWNCDGFFSELEQLIVHNVETAWHYIKSSPPVPAAILQTVIQTCTKEASSPLVVLPNIIKIAEGTFTRMLSLQLCPREYFVLALKFFSNNKCNTRAFWVVQEMRKYGYLLSKEMAINLISCYHPPATRLCDLLVWLNNAGLFKSLYNRLPQHITMETLLPEVQNYLELCARHQVKIHHSNTVTLVNFFMAHTNCEGIIRVLELSDDPCVISPDQVEFFMLNHPPEQLDHVTNVLVSMFSSDLCVAVSTAAWNYILTNCCAQQRSAKAMEIFHFMSRSSKVISKEVYLSLMVLHCDQRHPSEVLTVLKHQIRHHGDVSSVPQICQLLLKHQCWETVRDIVVCVINASHKVDSSTMEEIKSQLLQNNETQRWNLLLEKAREVGVDLDPVSLPADAESFLFVDTDISAMEKISSPPPACLESTPLLHSFNSPSTSATNQQLPPINDWLFPINLAEGLAPPPSIPANTPPLWQSDLLSLTLPLVEKSVMDGQWLSLGGILQLLLPIDVHLIQTISSAIETQPDVQTAFSALINGLKKFHQTDNQVSEGELTLQEQSLIGQVGVLIMMNAIAMEKWQTGLQILYLLHNHGIHYINNQGEWSPCVIAMAAVECCLHVGIPTDAIKVMRRAQWVSSIDPAEKERRDTVLEKLVRACLARKDIDGAQETLQALPESSELHQLVSLATAKDGDSMKLFNKCVNKDKQLSFPTASKASKQTLHPLPAKRVHVGNPVTMAAISSSMATKTSREQVVSRHQMKMKFRENVAQTICQRLKYYLRIKKITCHVIGFFCGFIIVIYILIRFGTEDFTHLAMVMYKVYYKRIETSSSGPWKVTTEMAQEIHKYVDQIFSQFTVYTRDLDFKLCLTQ